MGKATNATPKTFSHSTHRSPFATGVRISTVAFDLCQVCNKSTIHVCTQCKSASYCSIICQQADWPTHTLLCTAFSHFDALNRPTNEHVRAIFFPVGNTTPEFVWLHCEWEDEDIGRYQYAKFEPLLGPETFTSQMVIQYNSVLKRELSDTIYLCHRDAFLFDGSETNKSVASVTTTTPGLHHDWRGPIIAYGKVGVGIYKHACRDLDMTDFRHITDFLTSYNLKSTPAAQQPIIAPLTMPILAACIIAALLVALSLKNTITV